MRIFLFSLFLGASLFAGWSFPDTAQANGLVVCALNENDPNTAWNESAPCTACHILLMAANIIKWIMQVMTVIGIAVIFAMGILYIVSAGNEKMIGLAKGGIKAALIGIAIIICAWLIVSTIIRISGSSDYFTGYFQDGVFSFTCDTASNAGTATGTNFGAGAGGTSSYGSESGLGGNLSCSTGKCATNPAVAAAIKNNASGVDPNVLMALIDGGEGCNKANSSAGACGYAQTMPSIRAWCGIGGGAAASCTAVQSNLQLDINCAAKLIKDDGGMSKCFRDGGIKLLAACYNAGPAAAARGTCGEGSPPYCQRVESYYKSCQATP